MLQEGLYFNTTTETHYLSGIMQADTASEAQSLLEGMNATTFYKEENKLIFSAIVDVVKKGNIPNMTAVFQQLTDNKTINKVGGFAKLSLINSLELSSVCAIQNREVLKELAARRTAYTALGKAIQDVTNSEIGAENVIKNILEELSDLPSTMQRQNRDNYINSYAGNLVADFMAAAEAGSKNKAIATGFKELDNLLSGGLFPGLYVVGAISSLGKTTFCLQVADQIAEAGQDVLIFSLEMATDEIMAKSISRLTLKTAWRKYGKHNNNTARSTREVLTGALWKNFTPPQMDNLIKACSEYNEIGKHIKIIEGVGDVGINEVRAAVHRHINITGNYPLVIIDYLQILAPYNPKGTDKQNTDKAVLELKKLSRDYNLPIIAISSFNRDNYTQPVNLAAYKEAGSVEYSADVAIALQYDGMDFSEADTSEKERSKRVRKLVEDQIARGARGDQQSIQVKILKNRNGCKGQVTLGFYPRYNYFEHNSIPPKKESDGWEDMFCKK